MRIRLPLAILSIFLSILVLLSSCHKKDWLNNKSATQEDDLHLTHQFFNNSIPADTSVQKVRSYIKERYETSPKLLPFIKKHGLAIWDKAMPLPFINSNRADGSSENITQVLVPLFPLDSSYVKAALLCKVIGDSVSINLLDGSDYKRYAADSSKGMSAQALTLTLMMLDRNVQGNTYFQITDSITLTGGNKDAKFIRLLSDQQAANVLSRSYVIVEICWEEYVPSFDGQVVGCPPESPCDLYVKKTVCKTIASFVVEDETGGGDSDPGDGGIWIDPDGGGGTGWLPVPEPSEPPNSYKRLATYKGCSTYITPAGIAVILPEGAEVIVYDNIDVFKVYPNGALFAFKVNGKIYVSVQDEYIKTGQMTVPPPGFTGYLLYENGMITTTPMPAGILTQTKPPRFGNIQAVRMRVEKRPDGGCKVVRELVSVPPGTAPDNSYNTPGPVDYSVEYLPTVNTEKEEENITGCPGVSLPGTKTTLSDYINQQGAKIGEFLQKSVKSQVKIYLVDKAANKVSKVITKNGVGSVSRDEQTLLIDKFNNNAFTPDDEEVAIMASIENGQWVYEAKYNPHKLLTIHPKAAEAGVLDKLKGEIAYQADQAVYNIRGVGRATAEEQINTDNGERFYKRQMGLLETVAAFYDAGKHIIDNGTMPENAWDDGKRSGVTLTDVALKYQNSAFNMPSTIAGTVDQLIDEATGIIQLTKTALEAFRNPRATFNNLYNSVKSLNVEKIRQIISDITGISNYQAGGSRATYQGGRHTIQVAMAILGPVKLLSEGKKIVREGGAGMTNVQKFVPDGTVGHPSANALKNAADNNYAVINIGDEKLLTRNKIGNEDVFIGIEKKGTSSEVFEARKSEFLDDNGNQMSDAAIQEALEDGVKEIPLPQDIDGFYHKGKSGGWNKALNQYPLEPNKIYDVEGTKYHSDAHGRVVKVEVSNLQKYTPPWDRNGYQQSLKCNKAKDGVPGQDHGGHLLASQFGGPGEQINLIPMRKTLNQAGGDWYNMEQMWVAKMQNGISITNIKIDVIYGGNSKPTQFNVSWFEDGIQKSANHIN